MNIFHEQDWNCDWSYIRDAIIPKIDLMKTYMFFKTIARNNVINGDIAFAVYYKYWYISIQNGNIKKIFAF